MDDSWWRDVLDLDEYQEGVMRLPLDGRHLVKGPPGSGKTNLLLLRGNHCVLSGMENIRVVVFNRTLQGFIQRGAANYEFSDSYVLTLSQLLWSVARQEEISVASAKSAEESRIRVAEALHQAIESGLSPQFQMLLLDEAQDYTEDEIRVLSGLAESIYVTADSRQRIYGGSDPISVVEEICGENVTQLRFHYRNGLQICRFADAIGTSFSSGYMPISDGCNYNEIANPSRVDVVRGSFQAQVDQLHDRLQNQLRTYHDSELAVLAPTKRQANDYWEALCRSGLEHHLNLQVRDDDGSYAEHDPTRRVWISTIHGSKGLEFRAVHLVGMEKIASLREHQKRVSYTAVTRAKSSLTLYYQGALPAFLAKAISSINGKNPRVPLENIFGRR